MEIKRVFIAHKCFELKGVKLKGFSQPNPTIFGSKKKISNLEGFENELPPINMFRCFQGRKVDNEFDT